MAAETAEQTRIIAQFAVFLSVHVYVFYTLIFLQKVPKTSEDIYSDDKTGKTRKEHQRATSLPYSRAYMT